MAWLITRARLQSVTLDEATSYQLFAAPDWARCWYASSGNHVLNTILVRASTQLFGLSELTLRAPALMGAAIYIAAAYGLCVRISSEAAIRIPLFVCLVYSPFAMDYMIAARGYGLALGLLLEAVWAMSVSRFATASICVGLSFCANFSFAYIDAALILLSAVWAFGQTRNWGAAFRCVLPGAVTAGLICGRTLMEWPKGELYYGAAGLREMWESIVSATFDELNPHVMMPALEPAPLWLGYLIAAVLIWQTQRLVWAAQPLGLLLSRALAVALLCHWLAFRIMDVPLPMARTAIFFVPLALLLIGLGAALPAGSGFSALPRFVSVAALTLCALYSVGCLRLSHFKEWKFDAEVKETFQVLQNVRPRSMLSDAVIDWRYADPLNFYRESWHESGVPEFAWSEPHVEGKSAYVLYYPTAKDFIRKQSLHVIYRGLVSDVVVAVRRAKPGTSVSQ